MIKTYIAYTYESEDAGLAVSQIKAQLKLGDNLLANSVGIVSCHIDFVSSGVAEAIGTELPFDVLGAVSTAHSNGIKTDSKIYSIMLITSDTVDFVSVITPSLTSNPGKAITDCYKEAAIGRYGRPSLILTYAPFMTKNSTDEYVTALSKASYDAPCFGTVAISDTSDFSKYYTLFNGEYYNDRMVMTLFFGSVRPKFYVANISWDNLLNEGAVVTKSNGQLIMEIDERPAMELLDKLELRETTKIWQGMSSYPFVLDYHDNTPKVAKIYIDATPEDYILCAGNVPQGSTIYIASNKKDDILNTTGHKTDKFMKEAENAAGIIIYSCLSRHNAMGDEPFAEMDLVNSKINGKFPMLMGMAGGEICPTTTINEKSINRYHNNTFVACLF